MDIQDRHWIIFTGHTRFWRQSPSTQSQRRCEENRQEETERASQPSATGSGGGSGVPEPSGPPRAPPFPISHPVGGFRGRPPGSRCSRSGHEHTFLSFFSQLRMT